MSFRDQQFGGRQSGGAEFLQGSPFCFFGLFTCSHCSTTKSQWPDSKLEPLTYEVRLWQGVGDAKVLGEERDEFGGGVEGESPAFFVARCRVDVHLEAVPTACFVDLFELLSGRDMRAWERGAVESRRAFYTECRVDSGCEERLRLSFHSKKMRASQHIVEHSSC